MPSNRAGLVTADGYGKVNVAFLRSRRLLLDYRTGEPHLHIKYSLPIGELCWTVPA